MAAHERHPERSEGSRPSEQAGFFAALRRTRKSHRAFSFLELLVVLAILVILLSIFIPYASSKRETSRRAICVNNLSVIFTALRAYSDANNSMLPRVVNDAEGEGRAWAAFTGPDEPNPYAPDSGVKPNDVTAAVWLLVRQGYITDTKVFICPGADHEADALTDGAGRPVAPQQRGNFRSPQNLSYSYSSPYSPDPRYRLTLDTLKPGFVLMADLNPGVQERPNALKVSFGDKPYAHRKINSRNHSGAGQHVLYSEGTVRIWFTPYCAIDNDNIYTSQTSIRPTSQPTTTPATAPPPAPTAAPAFDPHSPGDLGPDIYPANDRDSYLVPMAR